MNASKLSTAVIGVLAERLGRGRRAIVIAVAGVIAKATGAEQATSVAS